MVLLRSAARGRLHYNSSPHWSLRLRASRDWIFSKRGFFTCQHVPGNRLASRNEPTSPPEEQMLYKASPACQKPGLAEPIKERQRHRQHLPQASHPKMKLLKAGSCCVLGTACLRCRPLCTRALDK